VGRWFEQLEERRLLAAVTTDLPDYSPGDTAQINASGFQLGETVQFQVLHAKGTVGNNALSPFHSPWRVTDGGKGDLDGKKNEQRADHPPVRQRVEGRA
jgi:hypothetical protein